MAFYSPVRHPLRANPELLLFLLALALLLISLVIVTVTAPVYHERPVLDSAIASKEMPVHFTRSQGSQSITEPVARPISADKPLESAVQALLNGPSAREKAAGLYSEIPVGTRLLGISTKGNAVTVNLSKEFTEGGGANSLIQRVEEVRNTVKSVNKNYTLRFAIEGQPTAVIGGLEVESSIR